ncbi:MAG: hypothetical protein AAGJ18_11560 [Bacteroidota bacterium]
MSVYPDFFSDIYNFIAQINNHTVKVSDLGSLFEVFLCGGLALATIPKVKEITKNFISNNSNRETKFLENAQADAKLAAKIFSEKTTMTDESLFNLKANAAVLEQRVEHWKENIVIGITHQFLILGLYCFLMLVVSANESIFERNREFIFFKSFLFATNFLFSCYYVFEFVLQKQPIRERMTYHVANMISFLIIAFGYTYFMHYEIDLFIILIMILINLIFPFFLTALGPFRLIRKMKKDESFKQIVTAKETAKGLLDQHNLPFPSSTSTI